ncbi:MAG: IolC myo-catabolism protein [Thiomonas sp. 15-66-11]|jgi:myo-inositol catabolism protein IolC|nr:MAG: IolC myo-catabolism protein [Thiomonas sp. 15-66-11]
MTSGDDQALYVLPFDHRHSYITGMFHFEPPLTSQQHADVCDSKQLIYEGFQLALEAGVPRDAAGILVDEEFGSAILRDAHQRGFITALSTESSGSEEFRFEYGDDFARHIEVFDPTFAKVLVRYNPEGDHALNLRQEERLKQLSDVCQASGRRFMFELLVPATAQQLAGLKGDRAAYDLTMRPQLMVEAIHALQDAGIEPDLWKIEGLAERHDCVRMVEAARRGGRSTVSCIVLGRGADEASVRSWLATAASVPGFIGFAVGRTSFWDAVAAYRERTLTRVAAATQIAERLREWVDIFERGRLTHGIRAMSGVAS